MEQDDYHRAQTVAQSKTLMRFLLNTYLGGTPLAAPDPDRPAKPMSFFRQRPPSSTSA
jgi:recombinational DNA repair protein (RecF pathway)